MSALKLHTLKQKLWAIVAVSFVARVIMFFVLPNSPSFLAPDEGTYASLAKWAGESKPANDFPAYGKGLYLSARAIIIPSSLLYRAGIHQLDAVRLVSSIYSLCSLVLIVALILMLHKRVLSEGPLERFNEHLIVRLVFFFAFLPSHFLWSNLGLREGPTEFWILITFVVFFVLQHYQKTITATGIVLLVGSIAITFSARPQVGWVVGISLIAYLLCKLKEIKTYFMISIICILYY